MSILPDILEPNLKVVFCGTAVSDESAARGHYYFEPSNSFWQLLHQAGFTPRQLRPDEDQSLPEFSIGMTDLVKAVSQSHDRNLDYSGARSVAAHIEAAAPSWVDFNGKTAGMAAAKALGHRKPSALGVATFTIGQSNVFILRSSTGANRGTSGLDGRATRVDWWAEFSGLAELA